MKQSKFPEGWDEKRVRAVIAHYESQSDDEGVAEDEEGVERREAGLYNVVHNDEGVAEDEEGVEPSETVMRVPVDLVPLVRELIAKRQQGR